MGEAGKACEAKRTRIILTDEGLAMGNFPEVSAEVQEKRLLEAVLLHTLRNMLNKQTKGEAT